MRIIRSPQFAICKCRYCGTIFQPETGDYFENVFSGFEMVKTLIRCPFCDSQCEVKREGVTDTNVGGKLEGDDL